MCSRATRGGSCTRCWRCSVTGCTTSSRTTACSCSATSTHSPPCRRPTRTSYISGTLKVVCQEKTSNKKQPHILGRAVKNEWPCGVMYMSSLWKVGPLVKCTHNYCHRPTRTSSISGVLKMVCQEKTSNKKQPHILGCVVKNEWPCGVMYMSWLWKVGPLVKCTHNYCHRPTRTSSISGALKMVCQEKTSNKKQPHVYQWKIGPSFLKSTQQCA